MTVYSLIYMPVWIKTIINYAKIKFHKKDILKYMKIFWIIDEIYYFKN